MILTTLILGFLFGAALQTARLNKFNTISGMATLEDFSVAKAIAVAVGLGAILMSITTGLSLASYHIKPLLLGGIAIGGLIFGFGMAILGYCPGTLAISLGEGSLDALVGIIGGLLAGLVYTLLAPSIKPLLGPDLGAKNFIDLFGYGPGFFAATFVFGALLITIAFILNKKEGKKNYLWLYAGIALAVLDVIVFLQKVADRPIGASTTYPYLADLLTGLTDNDYFKKTEKPGSWELIFLSGALLSGLVISLIRKDFKLTLIHDRWRKYKGPSKSKRAVWAFIGGFVMIFGARMAGGCTSGHVVSGGMQTAISSLVFGMFVFAGLLITGYFFYKKR